MEQDVGARKIVKLGKYFDDSENFCLHSHTMLASILAAKNDWGNSAGFSRFDESGTCKANSPIMDTVLRLRMRYQCTKAGCVNSSNVNIHES